MVADDSGSFIIVIPALIKITVQLKRARFVVGCAPGLLNRVDAELRKLGSCSRVLMVTSPRIAKLWGKTLRKALVRGHVPHSVHIVPDGERAEAMNNVESLGRGFAQS